MFTRKIEVPFFVTGHVIERTDGAGCIVFFGKVTGDTHREPVPEDRPVWVEDMAPTELVTIVTVSELDEETASDLIRKVVFSEDGVICLPRMQDVNGRPEFYGTSTRIPLLEMHASGGVPAFCFHVLSKLLASAGH